MWLSVIIFILIGFVVGGVTGFLLALKRQHKMIRHTAPDLSNHLGDQVSLETSQLLFVGSMKIGPLTSHTFASHVTVKQGI